MSHPTPDTGQQATWVRVLAQWLRPSYAWRRLRHNIWPKLAALVAATVLWFMTTSERRANIEQGFDVPITVRDTTGGQERRVVSNLTPETVRVTLAGRPERLRELSASKIEALLNVTGLAEGSFNLPIKVTAPPDTLLLRQTPDKAQGFVDTQLSRTLPITITVATPPEDSLPRYSTTPAEATVSGPSRVVATVSRLILNPLALAAGEEREAHLIALNASGIPVENVNISPVSVTLRRLDSGNVPVKALHITLNDPPIGLKVTSLSIQPSTVRVVAAPELLMRLREVSGTVVYHQGIYTAPVRLRLPVGAQALDDVNARLSVTR